MLTRDQFWSFLWFRPATFGGLMDLYESNYEKIGRLIPDWEVIVPRGVSRLRDGLDLHLEVLERCKYTTTLYLTHRFDDGPETIAEPALVVRVYHDARVAEATEFRGPQGFATGYESAGPRADLQRRIRMSTFLNKWLAYCLGQGHCFWSTRRYLARKESAGALADV